MEFIYIKFNEFVAVTIPSQLPIGDFVCSLIRNFFFPLFSHSIQIKSSKHEFLLVRCRCTPERIGFDRHERTIRFVFPIENSRQKDLTLRILVSPYRENINLTEKISNPSSQCEDGRKPSPSFGLVDRKVIFQMINFDKTHAASGEHISEELHFDQFLTDR